jgi:hypothetical protein
VNNIFEESYDLIEEFVSRPANLRLKAGTGRYSSLFRGTLFGSSKSEEVEKALMKESVKVLWLGSNPNVPESLQLIVNGSGAGHYQQFIEQKQTGHFSEVFKNKSGLLEPQWDPINKPSYQWQFYTEIFDQLFGRGRVLMANYVPWGSKDFSQLIKGVSAVDEALLQRMLEFSTMLNMRIIECIRPEIVVAPKSICQNQLIGSHLSACTPECTISYRVEAKVPFMFSVKNIVIGGQNTKVLISPQPSYTSRVGREHRERVQGELAKALQ